MENDRKSPATSKLEQYLASHGIPIGEWGVGATKTVIQLLNELESGEGKLTETETGELLRVLETLTVNVRYSDEDGHQFLLFEEKQIFANGAERRRGYLDGSVSGKQKSGEDLLMAARRELQEELGFEFTGEIVEEGEIISKRPSESYPGLSTQYHLSILGINLSYEQFNPEGYIEIQDGLTTYFKWQEIT